MCTESQQPSPSDQVQAKTVLVIDDEATSISIIKHALTGSGYNILTATSGEEGLQTAKDSHPDVIITDVLMPSMDGFMLVKELRRDENTKDTSILVLTARENVGDNLLRFGADAFLTKPINTQELISAVKRLSA
ncbi:MAG: response regulator [Candidatus Omnitrophica bacterium]|nr:response regulator [Candidatus Omnitrophota bacterium]